MIEPTESESKEDLDRYVDALVKISDEKPEIVKNAPNNTPVKRVDDAGATKKPILTWNMI
jgi:glycine dehydrogenase subunit 2